MEILLSLHSIVRWIIVIVALITLVVLALTWLRNEQRRQTDRTMMSVFTGLLDLQLLIGIILLAWMSMAGGGALPRYRLEHAATMIVAVIVAHVSAIWKRRTPAVRARNTFFIVILVLVLIWAGVQALPKGWRLP